MWRGAIAITFLMAFFAAELFAADADVPHKMLALANEERSSMNLPPVVFDESLAAVARAHSADMLANSFFAHESPTTGTPADRVASAKIAVQTQGENIAMGLTPEICHTNLMNSPPHRAAILGEYTHCGVGFVEAPNGMLYITQLFATLPPAVDFANAKAEIVRGINERRASAEAPPLAANEKLNELADRYALAMAKAGKSFSPKSLNADIRARGVRMKSAGIASFRTWNPVDICDTDVWHTLRRAQIGIGLAKNTEHKELGYGIIWTVVIFANE